MNKKIFTSIVRSNKTEAFSCIKPLYFTFTHSLLILNW
jgi:hypothetical protein